jgi:SARP family transcriptional regulator, regulator of embCAB operon
MRADVLGPIKLSYGERDYTPTAPKVRQVLALLIMKANQPVTHRSLIEELWGPVPPKTATTTAQTYIYQLRKLLKPVQVIETVPLGYQVRVPDDGLDYRRFERLLSEGRSELTSGNPVQAVQTLSQALAIWRGPVLEDVTCGVLLESCATTLNEERAIAVELHISAKMQLGKHREIVPELKMLIRESPYNEWLYGQLIVALHRSGRRGEALSCYQQARTILSSELGLEPSEDLRRIHREVLADDNG